MSVVIDAEKCGKIKDCPGEGLCIKLCEKGAIIEENGNIVIKARKLRRFRYMHSELPKSSHVQSMII